MPELPEVENVVRSLEPKLEGMTISSYEMLNTSIHKYNTYDEFEEYLIGCNVLEIKRRGKFILVKLTRSDFVESIYLIVHLAMSGVFQYLESAEKIIDLEPKVANHVHAIMSVVDANSNFKGVLIYSDYRRFGSVRLVSETDLKTRGSYSHLKTLQELGPEPFDENAYDEFLKRIRKAKYRDKTIKNTLLDQTVIAGAGNIYASECLLVPKVHPSSWVEDIPDDKMHEIFDSLVDILNRSIEAGGTSIKDYVNGDGVAGSFAGQLKLYNQHKCGVCSSNVSVYKIKDRMTYACSTCQEVFR